MIKINLISLLFILIIFVSCGNKSNENYFSEYQEGGSSEEYFEENYQDDYQESVCYGENYAEIAYKEEGGVKYLPVKINGAQFKMIFDTGCSTNLISKLEFLYLQKQGLISEEDIVGIEPSLIADGSIVENIVVTLKEVVIDDKIVFKNVKASVSDNISAPLLLGNEILNKVESYEINNNEQVIKFKLK